MLSGLSPVYRPIHGLECPDCVGGGAGDLARSTALPARRTLHLAGLGERGSTFFAQPTLTRNRSANSSSVPKPS